MINKAFALVIVILMLSMLPAFAQDNKSAQSKKSTPSSEITALEREIARLRAELETCKNSKNSATDTQRSEAIASLKAIRSALNTGANLEEFKKYQIESRIKVDALPNTPENLA